MGHGGFISLVLVTQISICQRALIRKIIYIHHHLDCIAHIACGSAHTMCISGSTFCTRIIHLYVCHSVSHKVSLKPGLFSDPSVCPWPVVRSAGRIID
ncbi:hypothetical protein EV424DRAFT_779376 [Suillus variegatus]|nr:hypothetical protein EV424DRAFT_779376 [Suillus variegatus]